MNSSFLQSKLVFRPLRTEEVEVRIVETKNDCKLRLYQDAQCAMNILDSTLGPTAWQREYYEAAGRLFCKIGIYDSDSNQWLWKSGTGTKSNTDEEKGLTTDAFKGAAVAWGIGRELYTAPCISINLDYEDMLNGKVCQSFHVGEMEVNEGVITKLTILDKRGKLRFSYPSTTPTESPKASLSFTSKKVLPIRGNNNREEVLRAFCEKKKESATKEDCYQLDRLYNYMLLPDKKNPSKSRLEAWSNFDTDKLWEWWMRGKTQ